MTIANARPARHPSHGCLFGCLGVLAILLLPVFVAFGASAWFLYEGFRTDPSLKAVSELVRRDGMAAQVLGGDIQITGVKGNAFSFMWGAGTHSVYDVDLAGSKASGTLAIASDIGGGHVHIEAMILTGPDGTRYDLVHHTIAPGNNPTTSI